MTIQDHLHYTIRKWPGQSVTAFHCSIETLVESFSDFWHSLPMGRSPDWYQGGTCEWNHVIISLANARLHLRYLPCCGSGTSYKIWKIQNKLYTGEQMVILSSVKAQFGSPWIFVRRTDLSCCCAYLVIYAQVQQVQLYFDSGQVRLLKSVTLHPTCKHSHRTSWNWSCL